MCLLAQLVAQVANMCCCYDVTQTNTDGFHWNILGCRYTGNSSHVVLMEIYTFVAGFPRGTVVKNLPASAGDSRDTGLIPGSGRSPGEGNGSPLQYSCLANPMDRGVWRATVHGVTELDTTERLNTHTHIHLWQLCHTNMNSLPLFLLRYFPSVMLEEGVG